MAWKRIPRPNADHETAPGFVTAAKNGPWTIEITVRAGTYNVWLWKRGAKPVAEAHTSEAEARHVANAVAAEINLHGAETEFEPHEIMNLATAGRDA